MDPSVSPERSGVCQTVAQSDSNSYRLIAQTTCDISSLSKYSRACSFTEDREDVKGGGAGVCEGVRGSSHVPHASFAAPSLTLQHMRENANWAQTHVHARTSFFIYYFLLISRHHLHHRLRHQSHPCPWWDWPVIKPAGETRAVFLFTSRHVAKFEVTKLWPLQPPCGLHRQ